MTTTDTHIDGEIKVIECTSVAQAEAEYFLLREEGCWQMVSALKIKWSWRKLRHVATFSMKKVEKAYHFDDYVRDTNDCLQASIPVLMNAMSAMSKVNEMKRKLKTK